MEAAIRWLPWSADAFARARSENRPVLLSISAPWCESCLVMDRTTYADPTVAALVSERFIPIRVDSDRRPDIAERYMLGGWPTTAFLTADGSVISGGTYVDAERMPAVLTSVAEAFHGRVRELGEPTRRATPSPPLDSPQDLTAVAFATFDERHGGFGTAPKFALTAPLELALDLYRETSSDSMRSIVETTLDGMGWGGLYDDEAGGFFHYAAEQDWTEPQYEKLLDVNAALLRCYVEAGEALQVARYRERAADVLRYAQTWLADMVDGGWAGSQLADREFYQSRLEARRVAAAPAVDRVIYAAGNARMVSAVLRAAEAFDDTGLGTFALKSLERVVVSAYRPGAGIAHCLDGEPTVRGLLDDQIAMAAAHLDAHAATGNVVYLMMAQELAHYVIRTMWDDREGGFFDRIEAEPSERIGLMCERVKPFVTNCDAARVLRRLASSKGDHDFGDRADATLAAMEPLAGRQGPLAAHYLLAQRQAVE